MDTYEVPFPEKIQGYLEKRSRVNIWRWWKKYWFVLDGKTLLYFKTKEDYERLGRCQGSINMALVQAVQPSCSAKRSYPIDVVTRTKTVQLSACDEDNRQKWLIALLNAIKLPEISSPVFERLSSRLSANLSLKRPFSQRSSQCDSETETTTRNNRISVNGCSFNKEKNNDPLLPKNAPAPDHLDSQTNGHKDIVVKERKSKAVDSANSRLSSTSSQRARSLYEEIVEEVLEITSRKLSNQSEGSEENEEFLKDLSAILQEEKKNWQESEPLAENAPIKPSRVSSVQCKSIANDGNLKVKETETDNETYESANESCYVTAESSEYEGDASSYSSVGSHHPNLNSVNTLTENTTLVSTGSEASVESILPQTGSLCNMLDVADGCESCNSVLNAANHNVPEESFPKKSNCINRRFSLNLLQNLKSEQNVRKHSE